MCVMHVKERCCVATGVMGASTSARASADVEEDGQHVEEDAEEEIERDSAADAEDDDYYEGNARGSRGNISRIPTFTAFIGLLLFGSSWCRVYFFLFFVYKAAKQLQRQFNSQFKQSGRGGCRLETQAR